MSDGSSNYGLIEPFETDDPMFCLGVEWEMMRNQIANNPEPFTRFVHRDNAERLVHMAERHKRFVELRPHPIVDEMPEDHFREWVEIFIGALKER